MDTFSQQDLSSYSPWVRHATRCAWIREHCKRRSQYAAEEIARLLNEVEEPIDVQTCKVLSQFIAPHNGTMKSGPKPDLAAKIGRHFDAAEIYGGLLAMIGEPSGPKNVTEAKCRACELLVCSPRTLDEYIAKPFDIVVAWARDRVPPESISDEENAKIRMAFYAKYKSKG